MTIAQLLAPSLAAGLATAGLGIGTITAPGVAEASGLRPTVDTTAPSGETVAINWRTACSLFYWALPGDQTRANYRACLSEAPSPARQNLNVAGVFGI
jgi:hypothetical protein